MTIERKWLIPLGCTFAVVAVAGGIGYLPTLRLAGGQAGGALLTGCLIGLLANWIGLVCVFVTSSADPQRQAVSGLMGMAGRFMAVLMLGLAAALSGWFTLGPLLIWVVISYLIALFVETLWLVRATQMGVEAGK